MYNLLNDPFAYEFYRLYRNYKFYSRNKHFDQLVETLTDVYKLYGCFLTEVGYSYCKPIRYKKFLHSIDRLGKFILWEMLALHEDSIKDSLLDSLMSPDDLAF